MPNLRSEVEWNAPPREILDDKELLHEYLKDIVHRLNRFKRDMEKTDVTNTVTTLAVAPTSGGSGGGGSSFMNLGSSYPVTAGSNTIPIPLSMKTGTIDYVVFAVLVATNTEFGAQILGQPDSKATSSFTYSSIAVDGTVWFDIKKKA